MKRLIITCIAMIAVNATVVAQKSEWSASEMELGTYSKPMSQERVIIGISTKNFAVVDESNKRCESRQFTKRLKFKGRGTHAGGYIVVKNVKNGEAVTVYAVSANKKETRVLSVTGQNLGETLCDSLIVSDGSAVQKATYVHHGKETNITLICFDGCFNYYAVKVN